MGGCSSRTQHTVNVDGGNWSEAYETLALKASDRTKSLRRQGTFSENAHVKMDGSTLRQINDYSVTAPLGKGAYGEVFLASRRNNREKYAIKVLRKSKLKKMGGRPRPGMRMTEGLSSIKVEIATMKKITHPSAALLLLLRLLLHLLPSCSCSGSGFGSCPALAPPPAPPRCLPGKPSISLLQLLSPSALARPLAR